MTEKQLGIFVKLRENLLETCATGCVRERQKKLALTTYLSTKQQKQILGKRAKFHVKVILEMEVQIAKFQVMMA